jgi:hypothetical protein
MSPRRPLSGEVLDDRQLNRATLARQLLLERTTRPAIDVVEHLVAIQAQVPRDPYVGLWSRIEAFDPAELSALVLDRSVVRFGNLRTTLHLVSAADAPRIRAFTKGALDAAWRGSGFAKQLAGLDLAPVLAAGRAFLERRPATTAELGRHLGDRWPDRDANAMAYALRFLEPIVQVPPRGTWGAQGRPAWTTLEAWLGCSIPEASDDEAFVLRYLAALGPAAPRDAQVWSWRTRLGAAFEALRPRLVTFRDRRGVELFDLPDAPRPDPDTPAPVRFLSEYDNLALSHKERSRVVPAGMPPAVIGQGAILIDGTVGGLWRRAGIGGDEPMEVTLFADPASETAGEVEAEARALAAFLRGGPAGEIRIAVGPAPTAPR